MSFRYLEPVAIGRWDEVALRRSELLSFYVCSGWSISDRRRTLANTDPAGVGGC